MAPIVDGVRQALPRDTLEKALALLQGESAGEAKYRYSYIDMASGNLQMASRRVHCLCASRHVDDWGSVANLAPIHQLSLWSMLYAGYEVFLWTFHPGVAGLPAHDNLSVHSADAMLDKTLASRLRVEQRWSAAHVADLVRLLAIAKCPGQASAVDSRPIVD